MLDVSKERKRDDEAISKLFTVYVLVVCCCFSFRARTGSRQVAYGVWLSKHYTFRRALDETMRENGEHTHAQGGMIFIRNVTFSLVVAAFITFRITIVYLVSSRAQDIVKSCRVYIIPLYWFLCTYTRGQQSSFSLRSDENSLCMRWVSILLSLHPAKVLLVKGWKHTGFINRGRFKSFNTIHREKIIITRAATQWHLSFDRNTNTGLKPNSFAKTQIVTISSWLKKQTKNWKDGTRRLLIYNPLTHSHDKINNFLHSEHLSPKGTSDYLREINSSSPPYGELFALEHVRHQDQSKKPLQISGDTEH